MRNELEFKGRSLFGFENIDEMYRWTWCAKFLYETTDPCIYPKQLIKSLIKHPSYENAILHPDAPTAEHHGFYSISEIFPTTYKKVELQEAYDAISEWTIPFVNRSGIDPEGNHYYKQEDMEDYAFKILDDEVSDGCSIYILDPTNLTVDQDYWVSMAIDYFLEIIVISADNSSLALLAYAND